ncbi:MAG: hypothetical protein FWG00_06190, partial [Coriobacteriia bacterium]|nr:hypothetical protein [Coriobacteriia bacterium]
MKRVKKPLALFLSVVLAITLMPLDVAFARESTEDALLVNRTPTNEDTDALDVGAATASDVEVDIPKRLEGYELTEREIDYTTYENPETGEATTVFYGKDVRFLDEETGEITDIDASLVETDEKGYAFENAAGDAKQYFPDTLNEKSPLRLESQDYAISFAPLFLDGNNTQFAGPETQSVKTTDIYEHEHDKDLLVSYAKDTAISLLFRSLSDGIKEEIILSEPLDAGSLEFSLEVTGLIPQVTEDTSQIFFFDASEVAKKQKQDKDISECEAVAHIPEALITDSSGNPDVFAYATYELEQTDKDTYLLRLVLPKDFMTSDERMYPLVIDPSTSWLTYRSVSTVSVHSGTEIADQVGSMTDIAVGRRDGDTYRTYLHIRGFRAFVNALGDRTVTSATLTLTKNSDKPNVGAPLIEAHEIKEPTEEQLGVNSRMTWKTKPSYFSKVLDTRTTRATNAELKIDLKNYIAEMRARTDRTTYGLALISNTSGACASFYGSHSAEEDYRPVVSVSYNGSGTIAPPAERPEAFESVEIDKPNINPTAANSTVRITMTPDDMNGIDTYQYRILLCGITQTGAHATTDVLYQNRDFQNVAVRKTADGESAYFDLNVSGFPEGCYRISTRGVNNIGASQAKGAHLHIDRTPPLMASVGVLANGQSGVKITDTSARWLSKQGERTRVSYAGLSDANAQANRHAQAKIGDQCSAKRIAVQLRIVKSDNTLVRDWHYPDDKDLATSLSSAKNGSFLLHDSYFENYGPGSYTIQVRPVDAAGNIGAVRSVSYLIPYPRLGLEIHSITGANTSADTLIARKVDQAADSYFANKQEVLATETLSGTVGISALVPERFYPSLDTKLSIESIKLDNGGEFAKDIVTGITTHSTYSLYTALYPDGNYRFTLSGKDGKGNISPSQSIECRIENVLPAPEVFALTPIRADNEFVISWRLFGQTAEIGGLEYSLDEGTSWTEVSRMAPDVGLFGVSTKTNSDGSAKQGSYTLLVRGYKTSGAKGEVASVVLTVDSSAPEVKIHDFDAGSVIATARARYFDFYTVSIKQKGQLDAAYKEVLRGVHELDNESAGFIDLFADTYAPGTYVLKLEATSLSGISATDTFEVYRPDTKGVQTPAVIELILPNDALVDIPNYTIGSKVSAAGVAYENATREFYLSGKKQTSKKTGQARDFTDDFADTGRYPEGAYVPIIAALKDNNAPVISAKTSVANLSATSVNDADSYAHIAGEVLQGKLSPRLNELQATLESKTYHLALPATSITLKPLATQPSNQNGGAIRYFVKVGQADYTEVKANTKINIREITGGEYIYASSFSIKATISRGEAGAVSLTQIDISADIVYPDYLHIDFLSQFAPKNLTATDKINYKTYLDWTKKTNKALPEGIYYEVYQARSVNVPDDEWLRLGDKEQDTYFVNPRVGDFSTTFYYRVRAVRQSTKDGKPSLAQGEYSNIATSNVIDKNEFVKRMGDKDFWDYESLGVPSGQAQIEKSWGNFCYTQTDRAIQTDTMMSEGLTRTYNSQSSSVTPFGRGQDFAYNIEILTLGFEAEQHVAGKTATYALKDDTGTLELFLPDDDQGNYHSFHSLHTKLEVLVDKPKTMTIQRHEGEEDDAGKSLQQTVVSKEVYFRLTLKDMTEYWFDVSGRLMVIKDTHDNYLTLEYDSERGYLQRIVSNGKREMSFVTNTQGLIVQATLPDNRGVFYSYNYDKTLKSVRVYEKQNVKLNEHYEMAEADKSENDIVYRYDYTTDALGRPYMTSVFDVLDHAYSIEYKSNPVDNLFVQAVKATNPIGERTHFAYGGLLDETTVIERFIPGSDSPNYRERAVFDDRGQIALSAVSTPGQLQTEELVTTYSYRDNLLLTQSALREYQELVDGKVVRHIELIQEQKSEYLKGTENEAKNVDDAGTTTTYAYGALGAVNANEASEVKTITADGDVEEDTSYEFDEDTGDELEEIDRFEDTITRNVYDERGNCISTKTYTQEFTNGKATSPEILTSVTTTVFDAFDNELESVSTEYGSPNVTTKTVASYDLMGNVTYEASGVVVAGSFVNVTSTTTTYDFLGRVIKTSFQEPGLAPKTESFTYDKSGAVLTSTDHKGITTTSTYDELGRNTSSTTAAPGEAPREMRSEYGYDTITLNTLAGKQTVAQARKYTSFDALGTQSISYSDALGNSLRTTAAGINSDVILASDGKTIATITSAEGESALKISASVFDRLGNTTHTLANPLIKGGSLVVGADTIVTTSEYSVDGKELSSTDALGNKTTYTYDSQGELASVVLPAASNVDTAKNTAVASAATSHFSTDINPADGGSIETTIDALGNMSQTKTDAGGKTLSISDYGFSQPTTKGAITTTFEYNEKG